MKANYCPVCKEKTIDFRKSNCECRNCKSAFVYRQFVACGRSEAKNKTICIVCGNEDAKINRKKQIDCKNCNTQYLLQIFQLSKKGKRILSNKD